MFEIWQCPADEAFDRHGYHPELCWAMVWRDTLRSEAPDAIFREFQRVEEGVHWPPDGYEGRSLTCGDLVNCDGTWYYCAPVGWNEVKPPLGAVGVL